ncbi:hypothetical protein ABC977_01055 [Thioalkalicoccus limnaeus]|uniref:Uncharacterized protein n=1 Tax=Thioalkalicoccus limnaeus TaxID=120681 RepID=A0ABV4B9F6_9GAMM
MKATDLTNFHAADAAARHRSEAGAVEAHLSTLRERLEELVRHGAQADRLADIKLQIARALVNLERGSEAWTLAREALDVFLFADDFESAADACDILFQANQPESVAALGQGIWLAVTYPIDPELTIELLNHVIEETPDDSDGAAIAATTALFLADLRATGKSRENLMFFATRVLSQVAHRHSSVSSQQEFDRWMDQLELREPEKFLVRLRDIVDVLVQGNWWFDPEELRARLPIDDDHQAPTAVAAGTNGGR